MQKQPEKHTKKPKKFKVFGPVATVFESSDTGSWRLERPKVDFSQCIKCGSCENFCPTNVIEVFKDKDECVFIDFDYCKGCGVCVNVCPKDCIELIPERGQEDDI